MPLLISTVVMFQAQNRETINSTWKVAVSFKIIMTTSVTRPCFTTQDQDQFFGSQTGFVLRLTVSDHITDWRLVVQCSCTLAVILQPITCSSRIVMYWSVMPSVLWHHCLGVRKGIRPVKSWDLVVTIWLELCTSYGSSCHHHLHHPCYNKIQNGNFLVPANPGPPGKRPLKWRQTDRQSDALLELITW